MTQAQLILVSKIEVLMEQELEPAVDVVKFNSDVSSDFEYYITKISKIFLDKEGNI